MKNDLEFNGILDIVFVGDIHGEFRKLGYLIKKSQLTNSVFVLLGDVGMGFNKPKYYETELTKLSTKIAKRNNHVIAFRGNHDDPSYYKELNKYGENVTLLPDYSKIKIDDKNLLVIGGALSVDRNVVHTDLLGKETKLRRDNETWWSDEFIVYDEEKLKSFTDIDIVATHSSPSFCFPFLKHNLMIFAQNDNALIEDVAKERKLLTNIHDLLKKKNNITHWYYGHFHDSNIDIITDAKGKTTKYFAVDIDEFRTF